VSGPVGQAQERVGALGSWAAVDAYRAVMAEASVADLAGTGSAAPYLRAMALESAIAEQMHTWVAVDIHYAFLRGAGLSEIAEATGMDTTLVARRWMVWAQGQRQLWAETGLLGMSEDDSCVWSPPSTPRTSPKALSAPRRCKHRARRTGK
jgi:hypothetical protein